MKVKRGVLCRDRGVIFQQIFLEGGSKWDLVVTNAKGERLPGCLYHIRDDEYVVAVPQLKTVMNVVVFKEGTSPENGSSSESGSFRIIGSLAKWQSRLNYRLRKDEAFSIRNTHLKQFRVAADIKVLLVSVGCKECIVKGEISVPTTDIEKIGVWALDERGLIVSDNVVLQGPSFDTSYASETPHVATFAFSLTIPRSDKAFFIVVDDLADHSLDSFQAVTGDEYASLIEGFVEEATCAASDGEYQNWFYRHKANSNDLIRQRNVSFEQPIKFSIIVPLYHTPVDMFHEMISSVFAQSYADWELILVNSTPEDALLREAVNEAASLDQRVKVVELPENLGISGNTNAGTAVAVGDYVAFFDHDDLLEPDILFEYAKAVDADPSIDLLYCDEDKMDGAGRLFMPYFKPDFSIDQLRNNNYVCHMLTIRRSLLEKLGPIPSEYDGAQDHYMTLRVAEERGSFCHIPKVLYHWRAVEGSTAFDPDGKAYASDAGIRAVQGNLDRMGIKAEVEGYGYPFTYRVKYAVPDRTKTSIVIPSLSATSDLQRCVSSILKLSEYPDYEVIIVGRDGDGQELLDLYRELERDDRVDVVRLAGAEANHSTMLNHGVSRCTGDVVVFLDSAAVVTDGNWLDVLAGLASREDVGAVAPTLFFPDGTYHHAGLAITDEGVIRLFQNMTDTAYFAKYMNLQDMTRNVSAVSSACMAIRKAAFDEVGGFDECYTLPLDDVDLCLRLIDAGYVNVYTADTSLVCSTSSPSAADLVSAPTIDAAKRELSLAEIARFKDKWQQYYVQGDPYYNLNLEQSAPKAQYFALRH